MASGTRIGKALYDEFASKPGWMEEYARETFVEQVSNLTKQMVQGDRSKVSYGGMLVDRTSLGERAAQAAATSQWFRWREQTGKGYKSVLDMTLDELAYAIAKRRQDADRHEAYIAVMQDLVVMIVRDQKATPAEIPHIDEIMPTLFVSHGLMHPVLDEIAA